MNTCLASITAQPAILLQQHPQHLARSALSLLVFCVPTLPTHSVCVTHTPHNQGSDSVMEVWFVAREMALRWFGADPSHTAMLPEAARLKWAGWKTSSQPHDQQA
jgi:hypothetical protein